MERWLYHALVVADDVGEPYAPASLAAEGFIHCSFASSVAETVALYFPPDAPLRILQIDPRRLKVELRVVETPRGPMPHLHGPLERSAVVAVHDRAAARTLADER